MFEDIFLYKRPVTEKLLQYGFQCTKDVYYFSTEILGGDFILMVTVDEQNVDTVLTEKEGGEEYVLYKTSAQGSFVGNIRTVISEVLKDIANKCFEAAIFKKAQTLRLLDYISSEYGNELEYLWPKLPENGIWRRKDTGKWYGAVLTVAKNKLGLNSNEIAEIIDLRTTPKNMPYILGEIGFYPGWHMNKKYWFTVILDDSVSDEKLYALIKESYALATK